MIITIPEQADYINVLISGGVDSTLLAYLVARQSNKPIVLHTLSPPKHVYQNVIVPILNYLDQRFDRKFQVVNIRRQKLLIREAAEYILSVYPGVILTGCNKVVTHFTPTVYIKGDTPPIRGEVSSENHIRPFINLDKIEILRIYQEHNILDLLSLTKSCGLPKLKRCGGCYFCMERAWAVGVLGINDINNTETSTI